MSGYGVHRVLRSERVFHHVTHDAHHMYVVRNASGYVVRRVHPVNIMELFCECF